MPMHLVDVVAPVVVAMLFMGATSAFKEPQRRHFNASMAWARRGKSVFAVHA